MVMIRNPYDRHRCGFICEGESMTDVSQAEAADINFIVKRFARNGELPLGRGPGEYADVTALQVDLQERIAFAQDTFERAHAALEAAKLEARAAELVAESGEAVAAV